MKHKLIAASAAATISGVLGLAGVASAMDFSVYGSIRGGYNTTDTDGYSGTGGATNLWDERSAKNGSNSSNVATGSVDDPSALGVTPVPNSDSESSTWGSDGSSRVGIKGSEDLGNGNSAGFHIERSLGEEATGNRHQKVWVSGNWGKLTFGEQDFLFNDYISWDGSWFLGGNNFFDSDATSTRARGIRYDAANIGPFSFGAMVVGNSAQRGYEDHEIVIGDSATVTQNAVVKAEEIQADNDSNTKLVIAAGYQFGDWFTVNIAHIADDTEHNQPGQSYDNTGIRFSGSFGQLDWRVGYVESSDNVRAATIDQMAAGGATGVAAERNAFARSLVSDYAWDAETIGVWLGFGVTDRDTVYLEWEDSSVDGFDDFAQRNNDRNATVLGYSRAFGPSTTFIIEGVSVDHDSQTPTLHATRFTPTVGRSSDTVRAILKVDF